MRDWTISNDEGDDNKGQQFSAKGDCALQGSVLVVMVSGRVLLAPGW